MTSFAILEDDDPALDDDSAPHGLDGLSLVDPADMLGCDAIICIDFEATCDDVREGSPSLVRATRWRSSSFRSSCSTCARAP